MAKVNSTAPPSQLGCDVIPNAQFQGKWNAPWLTKWWSYKIGQPSFLIGRCSFKMNKRERKLHSYYSVSTGTAL